MISIIENVIKYKEDISIKKKNIKIIIYYTLIILIIANIFGGRRIMVETNKPNTDWSLKSEKR